MIKKSLCIIATLLLTAAAVKWDINSAAAEGAITYNTLGASSSTDDITVAVNAVNNAGSGKIVLNEDVVYEGTDDITVKGNLILDLNGKTLKMKDTDATDYDDVSLEFSGGTSSITGDGEIISLSAYSTDENISYTKAVYVCDKAKLTIGEKNSAKNPVIYGIEVENGVENFLTVYGGTFNEQAFLTTWAEDGIMLLGGTFNGPVTAGNVCIDGAIFNDTLTCELYGLTLIIEDCDCYSLIIFQDNNSEKKYVTLNGGEYESIINKRDDANYGTVNATSDYLGVGVAFVNADGQIIKEADGIGYDINEYVRVLKTYNITFDLNGYGTDFSDKAAYGCCITEPEEPTSEKAAFVGWYSDKELSKKWDFSVDKVISDMTLYAGWTVAAPVFSPDGSKEFSDRINVTISTETEGADIYYTTDGSIPTAASKKYTGAIALTDTAVIRAIAVKAGMVDSEVSEMTYTKKITTPAQTTATTTTTTTTTAYIPVTIVTTAKPETAVTTTVTTTEATTTTPAETTTTTPAVTTTVNTTTLPEIQSETEDEVIEEENVDENPTTAVTVGAAWVIASAAAVMLTKSRKNK